jgi:hypothetical protein
MSIADKMGIRWQEAQTVDQLMAMNWQLDRTGFLWLRVMLPKEHSACFFMQPRPNYCDRGHWQVMCDGYWDEHGINTIDDAEFFPRLYMSQEVARHEIQRFVAWRAFKYSEGLDELVKHNAREFTYE